MADRPLPEYQLPIGARYLDIVQHQGPAFYPIGGETFDSQHLFGGGVLDYVGAGGQFSFNSAATGTYFVRVIYPISQGNAFATGSLTVKLQWFVTATGLEVAGGVNLSAEFIRLLVFGG